MKIELSTHLRTFANEDQGDWKWLTDQAVASAQAASNRLAAAYRQAFWLIVLGMAVAAESPPRKAASAIQPAAAPARSRSAWLG